MPVNYLNLYLFSIFGGILATLVGIVICYSGMSEASFLVNKGMGITTYYLDKNRYDLYLYGLVYSLTFGVALLLLLAAIVIPSEEQINKRTSESNIGEASGTEIGYTTEASTNEDESETLSDSDEPMEIELEPDVESFGNNENFEETDSKGVAEDGDSDVIYGTGKITDEAHKSFILNSPDSAVKFLLRKELNGKTLKSTQDEIYEDWQNRGLSRGKLRKHFLKIMEWDSVPELEVSEIYEQVKDKVYEIKHA
tara:strand:- start:60 stop:818 length:759 start_codon:yes stop_codon:yes gene_type:complete